MKNNPLRIILDTNLWISFLITKDFTRLDNILFTKECILVFSSELLMEFLEVAKRPKFRRFFEASDIDNLLDTIHEYAIFVEVKTSVDICRDAKDNFLLALAIDSQADALLTGDSDLLILEKFKGTEIGTLTAFIEKMK